MFVWKIFGRAIMVRDANCFHPFKDGVLSCIDCWWCQQSVLSITTSSSFFCSISSGILPPSQLDTVIRCGTLENVAMEAPCNFNFLTLPFVPLRSRASFLLCIGVFWTLSGIWDYNHISHVSCYIRNCSTPGCNKWLIQHCQFAVALDYQAISANSYVVSQMTSGKFYKLKLYAAEKWSVAGLCCLLQL